MRNEKNTKSGKLLKIGDFQFDVATHDLRDAKGGQVHLRRQTAQALAALGQSPGEVVSKDSLFDTIWPDTATTDDSLVQCIAEIRRTLGRDSVETFPKRGYLLRATEMTGPDLPAASTPARLPRWRMALAALLAAAAALGVTLWPDPDLPADTTRIVPPDITAANTLAVLPFVNLSGDPDQRFFSDGLSEDLITDLSKVPDLTVISRGSSFDFPEAESGFRAIAQNLRVRYLVRGTVRHSGDRVRINVALVDPQDGSTLWAERYDRDRDDPFDIQEDVVRQIVAVLSLKLGTDAAKRDAVPPDAYYMLLRGLAPLRSRTPEGNLEARRYFERALALDPGYARAHAYVAVTYGRDTVVGSPGDVPRGTVETGLESAITAIQLDPRIPHAYLALGVLNLALGEYDTALSAVRHAIRLDANFSEGYALLAEIGLYGADLDEALDAIRRAKRLHPHHPPSYHWIEGQILYHKTAYAASLPLLESAVAGNPGFFRARLVLAASYGQLGQAGAAAPHLEAALGLRPDTGAGKDAALMPFRFDARHAHLVEGLSKAGWSP